jgi:hypothetical protein
MIGATPVKGWASKIDNHFVVDPINGVTVLIDGSRIYRLDDGRVVRVWPFYPNCIRCGKPLKSERSQKKGFGPCCGSVIKNRLPFAPVVVIAVN